jgi:hypothetical protein
MPVAAIVHRGLRLPCIKICKMAYLPIILWIFLSFFSDYLSNVPPSKMDQTVRFLLEFNASHGHRDTIILNTDLHIELIRSR